MSEPRTIRALASAAAALLFVSACSGAASPSPSTAAASAPAASAAAASGGGSGTAYQLAVATGSVGKFLTGEDGKTLYVYKKDAPNATDSSCTGQCKTNWPPFELDTGETATAGAGVTGAIATITRSDDGKKQVTYNGAPLYYYAADKAAGDTNGQGLFNVWFVAQP
jgi:predicted lipoprotein with Yx(FWY)xxD motif